MNRAAHGCNPDAVPVLPEAHIIQQKATKNMAYSYLGVKHPELGVPHFVWVYYNPDGTEFCGTARFNLPNDKTFRQFHTNGSGLEWSRPSGLAPLYRANELVRSTKTVLIVAGEKAADAAQKLFPDLFVTTNLGGEAAFAKTDWSILKARQTVLWRDADAAGEKWEREVSRRCLSAGAASVHLVDVPLSAPKGWDLADPVPADWRLSEMLENAIEFRSDAFAPVKKEAPRIASELFAKRINWVWYPRIPGGMFTILGGMGGCGKGNIIIDFARTITTGGTWGDGTQFEKPGNVLLCELEDPDEQVVIPRMIAAKVDRRNVFLVSKISEMPADLPAFIREHDIRMVSLSPLTMFLDSVDNHDEKLVRAAIMALVDSLPETCAMIGTMHLNKSSMDAIQRLLGSVSFVNVPRSVLMAVEDKTERRMLLCHEKTNMKKAPALEYKVRFNGIRGEEEQQFVSLDWSVPTDADYVTADSVMASARKVTTSNPSWLLIFLAEHGPSAKSDVLEAAEKDGRKPKSIEIAKDRLKKEGRVRETIGGFQGEATWEKV
jgi:hypothetical protein